jgi:hypothetical protein
MASPYDAAIDMFDLPRYQGLQGSFTFPRREAPQDMARRSFLEGPSIASPKDEEWAIASQSPDPIGVMDELRKVREERETEDLIGAIAELDPAAKDYLQRVRGTIGQNPKALSNPAVGRILDFQSRFMPPKRPAPAFQYPQFQSQYQKLVAGGADPQAAADEVQMAEQQYGLQRQLAASGLPFDSPELMTDNRLDELKVLQTLAKAKDAARQKTAQFRVPTDLSEGLQDAVLAGDQERIAEATDAIARYQSELARFMPAKPAAQQPQAAPADLMRADAPVAAPQAQPATTAPQANVPVAEEEVSETVTEAIVPRRTGPNLAKAPTEEETKATALAIAPQRLSVDAAAALKVLGPEKLLEFYMAKTPENFTNPGDVRTAKQEEDSYLSELQKEWKGNPNAIIEAADVINELMGPYGYKTRRELDKEPRFVNSQGSTAPVIKSIRLKTS